MYCNQTNKVKSSIAATQAFGIIYYWLSFTIVLSTFLEVPGWLRTLRLHKYQYLFADMSYEELISTTEEFLESKVFFF